MTSEYSELPDSLLRLDDVLIAGGDESMLLTELDGFLCAVAVSPNPVAKSDYWPFEWAADERGVLRPGYEDLEALVDARLSEIEQELAAGEYGPLYEVDDDTNEIVWQAWVSGFQQAMLLQFDAWDDLLRDTGGDARGEAAMGLATALMLSDPTNVPDDTAGDDDWSQYDNAMEAMPEVIAQVAVLLYRLHRQS
ncbi:yecA family protein [Devosia lucknowensis]|uniref:YecA family protein n=1 Tax=Devosia lucknowensis TaxID=1096929 RepID=A0A1Y6E951_9HYPH|nr:UPF0149 family protein [Devosia lucknowensis]SMQ59049.1 yecA family protein [Devosia lucknowensis]